MYNKVNRASLRRRIAKNKGKFMELPVAELEIMLEAMDAMDARIDELERENG